MRSANLSRKTTETEISVELNLDGNGSADISTGIGFLDHMLHSFAIHGLFDLKLHAKGDLHVDPHHTIEDVALVLGSAFDQALGERVGIVRIADCFVPMDEALAHIALDLSGRPYAVIQVQWNTPYINGIPTSLFIHFFETFAITLRGNIHGRVLYGRDDHHQAEALFKAFARALAKATRLEPRREGTIPSAKGRLG
jgi:imidazoleglycerol-phosphate dehydratase